MCYRVCVCGAVTAEQQQHKSLKHQKILIFHKHLLFSVTSAKETQQPSVLFGLLSGASGVYSRRGNVTFSRHQTDSSCFHLFQHKLKRLTGNQTSCNLVEQPVRWWSWRALRVLPLSFKTTDVFLENSFTRTPGRSRCSRKSHVKNKQCVCFLF